MSWFYESLRVPSAFNGDIRCYRMLGKWLVISGDTGQASDYLNGMWRKALRLAIPKTAKVSRILILGFGTGGAFPEFYRRFPKAHIVTTEIDPAMVELGKRLKCLRGYPWPEVHIGRSEELLPKLQGTFDLIISDMFIGHDVASETSSPALIHHLARLLDPNGYLLVNAYSEPKYFKAMSQNFALTKQWSYQANHLAAFRPHGTGVIGDPLPSGMVPFFSCGAYLQREYDQWPRFQIVQAGEAWGVRQQLGPFAIERYHSDHEPKFSTRGHRLVLWDAITQLAPPPGWRRFPKHARRFLTGYSIIPPSGDIHTNWSELARRERKKWLAQTEWTIQDVDLETYLKVYSTCGKPRSMIQTFSNSLRHKIVVHGDRLHLYGAVSTKTGKMIAGLAILDVPEIHTSIHTTGFILPNAKNTPAGVGLINHWFLESQARGIRFCDFDAFFSAGEPKAWKGFSRFKGQFGTRFIAYPDVYWRMTS